MKKTKRSAIGVWIFFGVIAASNLIAIIYLFPEENTSFTSSLTTLFFPLVPVFFALIGALITSRQPGNVIGLLMMIPGLSLAFVVDSYLAPYISGQWLPPDSPTPLFLIILWFSNWNWFPLVTPIMYIMVLFPTGRPLSRRWQWLTYLGLGITLIFVFMNTFTEVIGPGADNSLFRVSNPIGFLKTEWLEPIVGPLLVVFAIWILLCAASLFVRFRRAHGVERAQIKWLFYGGAVFVAFYFPSFLGNAFNQAESILNLFLPVGMSTFPIAIAIAILRYRLYDIDLIIRKTLQYALLTGLLVLVYFGSVVMLQSLVENLAGEQSQLVIVISTLAIAALFNPLRLRVQGFIDRRFYRSKYDAEQALAQFASTARDEVDVDLFSRALLDLVSETMQPDGISIYLRPENQNKRETVENS